MDFLIALSLFVCSIATLIAATHYFLRSAGRLGLVFGVSPFVVGAVIVAFGTSMPEATIALFSVWNGITDIPVAQTIGSNIANILFVLGGVALLVRRLTVTKNLMDIEVSLIVAVTLLFIFIVYDGTVHFYEGLFLIAGFFCYVIYVFSAPDNRTYPLSSTEQIKKIFFVPRDFAVFFAMSAVIALAAHGTIVSTQALAAAFSVPEGFVAITAIAIGTSLPELVISIQAAIRREFEIIVGNVIGSNTFNILFVIGVPALITDLTVDPTTLHLGVPVLVGATVLFLVSSLSNRIHVWEGLFYILLYLLFLAKLFGTV